MACSEDLNLLRVVDYKKCTNLCFVILSTEALELSIRCQYTDRDPPFFVSISFSTTKISVSGHNEKRLQNVRIASIQIRIILEMWVFIIIQSYFLCVRVQNFRFTGASWGTILQGWGILVMYM